MMDKEKGEQLAVQDAPAPTPATTAADDEFPEGGWNAWLQVASSFALYFNHL